MRQARIVIVDLERVRAEAQASTPMVASGLSLGAGGTPARLTGRQQPSARGRTTASLTIGA